MVHMIHCYSNDDDFWMMMMWRVSFFFISTFIFVDKTKQNEAKLKILPITNDKHIFFIFDWIFQYFI